MNPSSTPRSFFGIHGELGVWLGEDPLYGGSFKDRPSRKALFKRPHIFIIFFHETKTANAGLLVMATRSTALCKPLSLQRAFCRKWVKVNVARIAFIGHFTVLSYTEEQKTTENKWFEWWNLENIPIFWQFTWFESVLKVLEQSEVSL